MRSLASPGFAGVAALFVAASAVAQPGLDEPAPPVTVDTVIAGPESLEALLEEQRGNALVVEFWATWCGPCIGVLDHWNELVAEFEGEPIRFLSVSNESAETIASFLEERQMAGWVASDDDRSMHHDFGVQSIPHTFLIDGEGNLRAETHPTSVTADALRALIAGETLDLPSATSFDDRIAARLDDEGRPEPLLVAEIRPSVDESLAGMRTGAHEYLLFGATALTGILSAYDGRETRLDLRAELPEQRYDFVFRSPGDHESRRELMRQVVAEAFGIEVERVSRRRSVLALRRLEGVELGLVRAAGRAASFGSYPGGLKGRGLDGVSIASALEFLREMAIVDETGLEGRWDVSLEWEAEVEGDLDRALREVGLELVPAEREIEILLVRSRAGAD